MWMGLCFTDIFSSSVVGFSPYFRMWPTLSSQNYLSSYLFIQLFIYCQPPMTQTRGYLLLLTNMIIISTESLYVPAEIGYGLQYIWFSVLH